MSPRMCQNIIKSNGSRARSANYSFDGKNAAVPGSPDAWSVAARLNLCDRQLGNWLKGFYALDSFEIRLGLWAPRKSICDRMKISIRPGPPGSHSKLMSKSRGSRIASVAHHLVFSMYGQQDHAIRRPLWPMAELVPEWVCVPRSPPLDGECSLVSWDSADTNKKNG
jgi:hypothetical protein